MSQPAPRQAVVIIHGIGEQVPMETIRGFVDAVTSTSFGHVEFSQRALSKPNSISQTLECAALIAFFPLAHDLFISQYRKMLRGVGLLEPQLVDKLAG